MAIQIGTADGMLSFTHFSLRLGMNNAMGTGSLDEVLC